MSLYLDNGVTPSVPRIRTAGTLGPSGRDGAPEVTPQAMPSRNAPTSRAPDVSVVSDQQGTAPTGDLPHDDSHDHDDVTSEQGRNTNGAGITMVRVVARRCRWEAAVAILKAEFSRMLPIRGA